MSASNPHGLNPTGPTLHGIDVASPQGHAFDWGKVAADGIRFAWVKATQGTSSVDPTFRRNWSESKRVGVLRGAYHFLSPTTDAKQQADHYLRTVGDLEDDDLHPMLDVESDHGITGPLILNSALVWTEIVEQRLGRPVVLYTYPSFWMQKLGNPPTHPLSSRPLWIAHYVISPQSGVVYPQRAPMVPRMWASWALWQTSGNRGPRIPGIDLDVDRDVFWGTEDGFRDRFTLARGTFEVQPEHPITPATPLGWQDRAERDADGNDPDDGGPSEAA